MLEKLTVVSKKELKREVGRNISGECFSRLSSELLLEKGEKYSGKGNTQINVINIKMFLKSVLNSSGRSEKLFFLLFPFLYSIQAFTLFPHFLSPPTSPVKTPRTTIYAIPYHNPRKRLCDEANMSYITIKTF